MKWCTSQDQWPPFALNTRREMAPSENVFPSSETRNASLRCGSMPSASPAICPPTADITCRSHLDSSQASLAQGCPFGAHVTNDCPTADGVCGPGCWEVVSACRAVADGGLDGPD